MEAWARGAVRSLAPPHGASGPAYGTGCLRDAVCCSLASQRVHVAGGGPLHQPERGRSARPGRPRVRGP
eukprot:1898229-Alexandrium_andersonii.AAC.1